MVTSRSDDQGHEEVSLTLMLLVAYLVNQNDAKGLKNDRNPGTWVLIREYTERTIQ